MRLQELLEDISKYFANLDRQPPVVNVAAPPPSPAPNVTVNLPPPTPWVFTVQRDQLGRIETITGEPQATEE
jgi:hypothetical protein